MPAPAAQPFVFDVDSTADEPDADVSDGLCKTAGGACTLRAAVMQATAVPIVDSTINVPAGTYLLGLPPTKGSLKLTSPGLSDGSPKIFIVGAGEAVTTIDANLTDRVVRVYSGRSAQISGISLVNGQVSASVGGAIFNDGALSLTDVTISNSAADGDGGGIYNAQGTGRSLNLARVTLNQNTTTNRGGAIASFSVLNIDHSVILDNASAANGGGIYSPGNLNVASSTLRGNVALGAGGAVFMLGTKLTLDDSVLDGNHSLGAGGGALYVGGSAAYLQRDTLSRNTTTLGGGIFNAGGQLFLSNDTVSQNQASEDGGGIYNSGDAHMYNSTIAYNEADSDADSVGDGAGVFNGDFRNFYVSNSLIVGNYLAGAQDFHDCIGLLVIYGNDKFSGTPGCSPAPGSTGTAAYIASLDELGILMDNGGPTETIAIVLPSNDLLGHGLSCVGWTGQPLATDQRGRPRPPAATERCDIGAFEYNAVFGGGFETPPP